MKIIPSNVPIIGTITVPGDKSISHRAIMLSSMAQGVSTIYGLLEGHDVMCTIEAMKKLGADIYKDNKHWVVRGGILKEPDEVLDMGNSGTSARLISGILSSLPFYSVITGDASLRKRSMNRLMKVLEPIGAKFWSRNSFLPLSILGNRSEDDIETLLTTPSAQLKSALLLAGINRPSTTLIETVHTRDHTENMMEYFGMDIEIVEGPERIITLRGNKPFEARNLTVPSDPSSAAFIIGLALLIKGSDITIPNVCMNKHRNGFMDTIKEMGGRIESVNPRIECGEQVADIRVQYSDLKAVTVPADRIPSMIDELPILSVIASLADGETKIIGAGELRAKESDRFAAIINILTDNGIKVSSDGDDIMITGNKVITGGGLIETKMDHRIAMSGIVLGLLSSKGVEIDDVSFIQTSFPGFFTILNQMSLLP